MPLLWVFYFYFFFGHASDTSREERQREEGWKAGEGKGAESDAVIDTIQHRGGRQCDKLQVLPWLPTPMCHSRLVPCPWPKMLPFGRQRKGTKGNRR